MRICSVEGCDKVHHSRGFCNTHRKRMKKHGMLELMPQKTRKELLYAKFILKAKKECWMWTGYRTPDGYGRIQINYKRIKAHRLSWEVHNGSIPEGLFVLHKCDVRDCVNPNHLFLGTQKDNIHDAIKKGRINFAELGIKGREKGCANRKSIVERG